MRTKLVVGNWKMNLSTASAIGLVDTFVKQIESRTDVDVAVCPPFVLLPKIKEYLKNSHMKVGAQDVFWEVKGAFTGKVSAAMLYEFCTDYCIVGHSETRGKFGKLEIPESTVGYFAETDETVNLKIKSLLFHSITPILCVGETLAEREAGQTDSVVQGQLNGALQGLDVSELYTLSIAYEPVWAIGTGKTCNSAEANRVCGMIRSTISEHYGQDLADEILVLYGGSVKANNAKELFSQPEIDGGLVGGSSLDAVEFAAIVKSA